MNLKIFIFKYKMELSNLFSQKFTNDVKNLLSKMSGEEVISRLFIGRFYQKIKEDGRNPEPPS